MLHNVNNHYTFLNSGPKVLFSECFQKWLSEAVAGLGHKGSCENNHRDRNRPAREEVGDYYGSGVVLIIFTQPSL